MNEAAGLVSSPEATIELIDLPSGEGFGRRRAVRWLQQLVVELAPDTASFCVRFVDDPQMRELNREWRGKDRPTDVLSFPGERTPEGRHLGDLVISLDTARRQACSRGRPLLEEVQVLLLHGVLHCLGHDHESDDGEMEALERRLRRHWIAAGAPWAVALRGEES